MWRTYRSSPMIRFLLAHKCQRRLHLSASELCHGGAAAGLQSISREEETCSSTALINSSLLRCFTYQLVSLRFSPPVLLHHVEVFSGVVGQNPQTVKTGSDVRRLRKKIFLLLFLDFCIFVIFLLVQKGPSPCRGVLLTAFVLLCEASLRVRTDYS